MSHNWRNHKKKLKFLDAKNTRKIYAFFSMQKSSETLESEMNKVNVGHREMDFIEQSKSRPSASTSSAESQFIHVSESETMYTYICIKIRRRLAKYLTVNFPLN